jgi:hypothetical protein
VAYFSVISNGLKHVLMSSKTALSDKITDAFANVKYLLMSAISPRS